MKIDESENLIWRCLLGELAESGQTALEQELRFCCKRYFGHIL
jgi:hypothetical protein